MLKQVAMLDEALTDLETARDYLKLKHGDHDHALRTFINASTAIIESYCERKLIARDAVVRVDGTGNSALVVPDWPVVAVDAIAYYTGDFTAGSKQAMDITGLYSSDHGVIVNPAERFPIGRRNIEVTGRFGYDAAEDDHKVSLTILEFACLRMTMVHYQDFINQIGRSQSVEVAGATVQLGIEAMPPDVKHMLARFRRIM